MTKTADIIKATADYFDTSPAEITGEGRGLSVVLARHVAIYVAITLTGQSATTIGRIFNRDHTTVGYAVKAVKRRMAVSETFRNIVSRVINELSRDEPPNTDLIDGMIIDSQEVTKALQEIKQNLLNMKGSVEKINEVLKKLKGGCHGNEEV